MEVILERNFLKSAKRLPENVKLKLAKLVEIIAIDPHHPLLHTKKLSGELIGFLSFRITRDWRVIFYFDGAGMIHLLDVSHRKDIYQ